MKRKVNKSALNTEQLPATPETKAGIAYCPPPDELDTGVPELKHLGGSKSDQWNLMLCNQVMSTAWYGRNPQPGKDLDDKRTAILSFMAGVNPKDTIEGMMAAQLFASHAAAMECYRRAMLPDQSLEGKQMNLTLAAKLTKANAEQAAALSKYRGKGQQKVVVEHVHVYQGGQAIVGQVTPGGSMKNLEAQPHAIGYAECSPVRRENEEQKREALPVAGNA
ncbi:hypothetical protein LPJ38_03185 [Bradyrhizobium daqingense]|uniref:Uncharacterized protein n=1 Tax=Bradyrhizobium daqingense TaxID=993502 RepID=A0A562LJU0_9BRAD|nr:hypothetical protein [Bradyrhizobium daqingense]TWI07877.1 hypothetical protein IQ17_02234 [Bradyrhizobium daqingense]UFS89808.1 hypothetical protein LPJ38_03185 [Bradyrhizobium daqingense]